MLSEGTNASLLVFGAESPLILTEKYCTEKTAQGLCSFFIPPLFFSENPIPQRYRRT